jgi:putative membrane protein
MLRASRCLLAALAGAQVAYGRLPGRRTPVQTLGVVGLLLAATATETAAARGRGRAAALLGSAAAVGYGAEVVGVATGRPFGHYRYGPALGRRWRGVPFMVAVAWTLMSRPSWAVAGLLTRRRAPRALLAGGALTAWDVFIDPRMVREGYWSWPGGGRYEGIPATNFLGWWVTGTGVFALWSLIDGDDDPPFDADGALALYAWTWIGETFANAVIWRRPRVAAAGAVAMGAFVVPALRARSRRRAASDLPVVS